jgi:3-oxoadipate enol-lactonase
MVNMPKANVNGINLYYQVHGKGEPLFLIQGFGGGHRGWFFQTRAFKKYFQVIIFDNRGIGRSDKALGQYTVGDLADEAIGLMDYLHIGKAHILGMSMGGMVAQELAINYPDRLKKLVLVCTNAGDDDVSGINPELLRALGVKQDSVEPDLKGLDFNEAVVTITALSFNRRLYRMMFVPLTKFYVRRAGIQGHFKQMEAVIGHSTKDRLHLIKAPTLVMTGTKDRIMSPNASEVIARLIPNAKLVKIEGASHAFSIEMPKRFNQEVLNFLKD